jgi:hypothetical protein
MTKYNFQIDPKVPDETKIIPHKDFSRVMQQYQKMTHPLYSTPLYRYGKVFLSLLLILICAWLIAEYGDDEEQPPTPKKDSLNINSQSKSINP